MRKLGIITIVVIVVLGIMQLIPTKLPDTNTDITTDLLSNNPISDTISLLLKNACYDCHSNKTVYPWYSYVAPASWLVIRDTREGRKHLNFSEWESYSIKDKLKYLSQTAYVLDNKEMPFPPYMLMHKESRLTKEDREKLILWTETFAEYALQKHTSK